MFVGRRVEPVRSRCTDRYTKLRWNSSDEGKGTRMKPKKTQTAPLQFAAVPLREANRRAGKHHKIVSDILSDLAKLDPHSAIKIDLVKAGEKKADLRAALLRAAKKQKLSLATSSDEKHLYVFRSPARIEHRETVPAR